MTYADDDYLWRTAVINRGDKVWGSLIAWPCKLYIFHLIWINYLLFFFLFFLFFLFLSFNCRLIIWYIHLSHCSPPSDSTSLKRCWNEHQDKCIGRMNCQNIFCPFVHRSEPNFQLLFPSRRRQCHCGGCLEITLQTFSLWSCFSSPSLWFVMFLLPQLVMCTVSSQSPTDSHIAYAISTINLEQLVAPGQLVEWTWEADHLYVGGSILLLLCWWVGSNFEIWYEIKDV